MKKGFILGLATGIVLTGASFVFANSQIQAILNDQIKVTLDGVTQVFRDETTNEVQNPITYKDRTYLPLRTVANLVGVDVDYDAESNTAILKNEFNFREYLEHLDYSNSLICNSAYGIEWKISSDGKIIEQRGNEWGDKDYLKIYNTNYLLKNIKSFRVGYIDPVNEWIFLALTENGELYTAWSAGRGDPHFELEGSGYDGICLLGMYSYKDYFVARTTEVEDVDSFVDYTIFTDADNKFTFNALRP